MVFLLATTIALMPCLLAIGSDAHTWIDCIDTDRSKVYDQSTRYIFGGASGNGFCQGYGTGYPGRGEGDIGMGYTYKMLRNEVEAGTPVCKQADANTYSDWRKRIALAPGQTAFFGYLPNGHIVKDKKAIGTQHGIYWTGQVGTSLSTTLEMTPEHLLNGHTADYDDGNCGESVDRNGTPTGRAGDGKPCVGTFTIPVGTVPGIYHMVWYWTFWLDDEASYVDQVQATGYFGAAYSTCFEVEVIADGSVAAKMGAVPAVTPALIAPKVPLPPYPIGGAEAIKPTAAAAATLDVGLAAPTQLLDDSDDKDLLPSSKDVATVHGAKQSLSNSSDLEEDGEVDEVRQEEASAESTPDDEVRQEEASAESTPDEEEDDEARQEEASAETTPDGEVKEVRQEKPSAESAPDGEVKEVRQKKPSAESAPDEEEDDEVRQEKPSAESTSDEEVRQEKPSAPSKATFVSSPRSHAMTQSSSAAYIKTSEGWLVLGVALLLGALV